MLGTHLKIDPPSKGVSYQFCPVRQQNSRFYKEEDKQQQAASASYLSKTEDLNER